MTSSPAAGSYPPPGFLRFWTGETVSSFGVYVTLISLQTLVVLELDGSAQQIGFLNAARLAPYLVLGVVVGALVDRRSRRPVMVVTDLLRAGLLLLVPLAWALDALTFPLLLGVVAAIGTASLVNDAASLSFVTRLIPDAHLQRAWARLDTSDAVAQTTGPALGGLLVRLVGAPLAVLVQAGAFLFSAVVVLGLRVGEPPPALDRPAPHLRREMAEGVRWIYRGSGLARLAVSTHVWFTANAVLGVVVAPYALLTLGLSPFQLGVATGLAGVGAVVGASVTTAVGRLLGTGGAIITARSLAVAACLVMALAGLGGTTGWTATLVLGAGQLLFGLDLGLSNSHEMAYRQRLTPDALQARTNITMRSLNRAVMVVGAPLAGLLADTAGIRPTLLLAAAVFAAATAVLVFSPFRSVREDAAA